MVENVGDPGDDGVGLGLVAESEVDLGSLEGLL